MPQKRVNKTTDEIASMFLGLVIVGAVVLIIFNIFNRVKGRVDIPGISDNQQLELTGTGSVAPKMTEDGEEVYQVKKGDSLWKIAEAKLDDGNKWTEIAKANNLTNPGLLFSGQELVLPKMEKEVVVVEAKEYTVVRGDSLWKIAVNTYADGYEWPKIWEANRETVMNPGLLEIGMVLKLPEAVTGK